jgi:hypothetical protein
LLCYCLFGVDFAAQLGITLSLWKYPSVDTLKVWYNATVAASAYLRFTGPSDGFVEHGIVPPVNLWPAPGAPTVGLTVGTHTISFGLMQALAMRAEISGVRHKAINHQMCPWIVFLVEHSASSHRVREVKAN